jgi:hypothetical protein
MIMNFINLIDIIDDLLDDLLILIYLLLLIFYFLISLFFIYGIKYKGLMVYEELVNLYLIILTIILSSSFNQKSYLIF